MRAQTDIVVLIALFVLAVLFAPFALKIIITPLDKFSEAINATSPQAAQTVLSIKNVGVTWMDWMIVLLFLIDVLVMFIFSFMVDTHPIFLLFYIITAFLTIIFSPYLVTPVTEVFGMPDFATEVGYLPMTSFIMTRFSLIILAIIIINGIIMYAKLRNPQGVYR